MTPSLYAHLLSLLKCFLEASTLEDFLAHTAAMGEEPRFLILFRGFLHALYLFL